MATNKYSYLVNNNDEIVHLSTKASHVYTETGETVQDVIDHTITVENEDSVRDDEINLSEINDNSVSGSSTWSSQKIEKNKADKSDIEILNKRISMLMSSSESTVDDAEIVDIRLGADEVEYSTAGEAVRTQFSNMKKEMNETYVDINDSIKQDLENIAYYDYRNLSENTELYALKNGYINRSAGTFGKVEEGKTYTIQADVVLGSTIKHNIYVRVYTSASEFVNITNFIPELGKHFTYTFEAPETGDIAFTKDYEEDFISTKVLENIQVEKGSYPTRFTKRGEVLPVKRGYVLFDDFGAKANDSTFDNSPILEYALKFVNTNGINLIIDAKDYYFKKPIVIDYNLNGVNISGHYGTSNESDRHCSRFIYTGTETFITINENMRWCNINGLLLTSENNCNCIDVNAILTRCEFRNIAFNGFGRQLYLGGFAYTSFTNCSFGGAKTLNVKIGEDQRKYTPEYLLFEFCNFEGSVQNTKETGVGAIEINSINHVTFQNCDICNHGDSFGVKFISHVQFLMYAHFYNCNFARNKYSILLDSSDCSIGNVYADGCTFIMTGQNADERAIYDTGKGTNRMLYKSFFRLINYTEIPTYAVELNGDIGCGTHEILDMSENMKFKSKKKINGIENI